MMFVETGSHLLCGMMLFGNGSLTIADPTRRVVVGSYSCPKTIGRPSASVPTAVPDLGSPVYDGSRSLEKSPVLNWVVGTVPSPVNCCWLRSSFSRFVKKNVLFLPL